LRDLKFVWEKFTARPLVVYGVALAIGLIFVLAVFPLAYIFALDNVGPALTGDPAQHVIVQRYFLGSSWHWPALIIPDLGASPGTNLGLADGVPLVALILKLLQGILPPGFHAVFLWLAFSYMLQPVAAVFALRAAGETRWVPMIAVAVIALCMPFWLGRYVHVALSSHFLILFALGVYFRGCAGVGTGWVCIALLCASLLVHPYLFLMVAALLFAAPVTLAWRRDPDWSRKAISLAVAVVAAGAVAFLLGYGGAQKPDGFGFYSMNLLGPIYPTFSALFKGYGLLDATGGQWEGQAYLGGGLIVLVAVAVWVGSHVGLSTAWRRHSGLISICVVMFFFALSNRIYFGPVLLFDFSPPPGFIQQFRATGRMFWPVAYVLLIGSIVVLMKFMTVRRSMAVLIGAALLQFVDTANYRAAVKDQASATQSWLFDMPKARVLLANSKKLTIRPRFYCGASIYSEPAIAQFLVLASSSLIPVDSFFSARPTADVDCGPSFEPLAIGELRLYVAETAVSDAMLPDSDAHCRVFGQFIVCSLDHGLLAGLPSLAVSRVKRAELNKFLFAADESNKGYFTTGWQQPEAAGRWTDGASSNINLRLTASTGAKLRIRLDGHALAAQAGQFQQLSLSINGALIKKWTLHDNTPSELVADFVAPEDNVIRLTLNVATPVRPIDRGINDDHRMLGFFLKSLKFETVPAP